VEGRVHDHEVQVGKRGVGLERVGPEDFGAGVVEVAAGAVYGAAVEVDQRQALDAGGGERGSGEHAYAAAEVGAAAGQGGEMAGEEQAAGVRPLPAEHAGLGPEAVEQPRCALGDSFVQADGLVGPGGLADAVVAAGCFGHRTPEGGELLGEACAAAVLGGEREEARAGGEDAESVGEDGSALFRAGGREDRRSG
jgi:hypothetical protein